MDDVSHLCLYAGSAALMGTAIGLERQWGQHPAGLRTNALVAFGASLFVSLPHLFNDSAATAHLAGQVVTGVGFLGGGVILREGLNIRGMNTAATLWCSAAIGALSGAGLLPAALIGTAGVLALNLALRPVNYLVEQRLRRATNVRTLYHLRIACQAGKEGVVRAALLRFSHDHSTVTTQAISTQECGEPGRSLVVAELVSEKRDDRAMEDLMALVNDEPAVSSVSWEKGPAVS
jgi:putative Mg2+ transporter-C (MgtC) family protein